MSTMTLLVVMAMVVATVTMVDAQQFSVVHNYAHHEGSPSKNPHQGASPEYTALLKAHDRRRLASVADFPLRGDDDPTSIGLYFTQITLGTPPRQYYVQVDTGSDILWLNCAPCPGCPRTTDIQGISLQHYDPSLSTTCKALGCTDAACLIASNGAGNGACTAVGSMQACSYLANYGDGSGTQGYFINDVLTFRQVENSTSNYTANIYFGCGTTQSGNLLTTSRALDGLMGFGQAQIAVSTQLAAQGKVGQVFAHCLQGDDLGGGTLVIGNILEPNISYTPIVPKQYHYSVGLENIAVGGVNISDPVTFEVRGSEGGAIMDSGTTLSYIVEPAYTQFISAINSGAPVASQQIPDPSGSSSLCWIYNGMIATTFPSVTLFFSDAVVMNLAPKNYLYQQKLTSGESAWCMGWMASSATYSIFGDIVLKDQLVVYDNENQRVGWRPFDCTQSIRVSAPNSTTPMDVLPGSGDGFSAATSHHWRLTTIAVLSCVAFSLFLMLYL